MGFRLSQGVKCFFWSGGALDAGVGHRDRFSNRGF